VASLFKKDPAAEHEPSVYDRIGPEIAHLKKGANVRHGPAARKRLGGWVLLLFILGLVWLYIMDPVLYSLRKVEAIHVYLYLHSRDSDAAIKPLAESRMFTSMEISGLNQKQGSFDSYFSNPKDAEDKAAGIVSYMNGVRALQAGDYKQLDTVGKIRCILFIRNGIPVPTSWDFLNPSID